MIVDGLSRWPEFFAIPKATAAIAVKIIENEIICRYGPPKVIVSDCRSQFTSDLRQKLCKEFGVQQRLTAPYHHNPVLAERTIQMLKQM